MKGFGIVEILLAFFIMSVLVAGVLHLTLIQMEDGKLQQTRIEETQRRVNSSVDNIEKIREQKLKYEENVINNYRE